MILHYFLTAWRNQRRNSGVSLLNVAGLTIGIICFVFISFWVRKETSFDSFHANSGRIFRVILHKADDPADPGFVSAPFVLTKILKDEYPQIEDATQIKDLAYPSSVRYENKSFYEERFFYGDSSLFKIFSFHFREGDPASALSFAVAFVTTGYMVIKTARSNPAVSLRYE